MIIIENQLYSKKYMYIFFKKLKYNISNVF